MRKFCNLMVHISGLDISNLLLKAESWKLNGICWRHVKQSCFFWFMSCIFSFLDPSKLKNNQRLLASFAVAFSFLFFIQLNFVKACILYIINYLYIQTKRNRKRIFSNVLYNVAYLIIALQRPRFVVTPKEPYYCCWNFPIMTSITITFPRRSPFHNEQLGW